jgi:radical SAM protein with 4Fe4S-binding SPASM domain
MTAIKTLLEELANTYHFSEPIYLSNFFNDNGEKWLHDQLQSQYQPVYANNQRIVVVQDCADQYDYANMPGQSITALQKYASQIDISNSFILLLSSNTQIDKELEQARTMYGTDLFAINHVFVSGYNTNHNTQTQDTFCPLPWVHLYIGPDGNVLPCCVADHAHPIGNIEKDSVDRIIHSEKFNTIRRNMLTSQRSKECDRCYKEEDNGIGSQRNMHITNWKSVVDQMTIKPDGTLDEFKPMYLDVRLSNICNLKCRMCSGYFSSGIMQEDIELFNHPGIMQLNTKQRAASFDEILKYVEHAEKIYFAGGEPLIAKEHYDILNALINCGNTDLELNYNTNFTQLYYKNYQVTDLWKHFPNIIIGASLDAIGEVAEYVRHGTHWPTIEQNLVTVKSQCPHVEIKVASTVGMLNIESLIELQKTWHTQNKLDISKFKVHTMISPAHLTVQTLPVSEKQRLQPIMSSHIEWCRDLGAIELVQSWQSVLEYMMSSDSSHNLGEFKRLTGILDAHRNENLLSVLPNLKSIYD